MSKTSGSRPHRFPLLAVALLLILAMGGCSRPSDEADVPPAAVESDDGPLSDVTFVPLARDPAEVEVRQTDPAGPGPLNPGEAPQAWTRGDDQELDDLWNRCEAGDGLGCDELFDVAPIGSDYERFGLSCGNRPGVVDCQDIGAGRR